VGRDRKALAAAVIRIALAPRLLRNDGAVEPVCFGAKALKERDGAATLVGWIGVILWRPSKEASASKSLVLIAFVLAIAALYFGRQVCIPLALALVFSFLLTPFVSLLEKLRFGRVPAVLTVLILSFVVAGAVTWGVARQLVEIMVELPDYKANLDTKIRLLRPRVPAVWVKPLPPSRS